MKNKIKKNLLSVLFAGTLLSIGFGVGGVAVSNASADQIWTENTGTTTTESATIVEKEFVADENGLFRMQGTAIRLGSGSNDGVDYNAIRFRMVMEEDAYWQIRQKAYTSTAWEIGFLVLPRTVLGAGESLTVDTPKTNKQEVLWYNWKAADDVTEAEGEDYVQMVYNLYNLPANDEIYKWGICARGFIRYLDENGETQYFYTNTIEHSMADVATAYVKNYENKGDAVYSKPEYINQANEYRPDCEVIYRDGDKYERLRVEYGDTFVYDESGTYASATYTGATEYKLPKAANATAENGFQSLLREGATTTIRENGLNVTQDVQLYYLYATTRYIYQSFDIERVRDSKVTFEEYPWANSATVQSITITNKATSASISYSVDAGTLASVWDASTKTMTIPEGDYTSWFSAGWDAYAKEGVTVQILTNENNVVYQTTGALCTMSIKTEQDLYDWGDYSKVDYINYNSTYLKNGPTANLTFYPTNIPNTWTDWASSGIPNIRQGTKPTDIYTSQTYSDFLWGGYFVLANDIDCTEGKSYQSPIKYENTVQAANPNGEGNITLFPSLIRYNYVAASGNTAATWSVLQGMTCANGRFFGFWGTFDGRGYNIDNLKIVGGSRSGFIGTMGHMGVLKNVSFTNATQGFPGGFICSSGAGDLENIYVHFAPNGRGSSSHITRSGVFYSQDMTAEALVKNCFVHVTQTRKDFDDKAYVTHPTTGETVLTDVALGAVHLKYGIYQGVYAVADYATDTIVLSTKSSGVLTDDRYGVYDTFDDLAAANIDFSSYTTEGGDFWTTKNGFPFPKKLSTRKLHMDGAESRFVENAKISNYWGATLTNVYTENDTRLGRMSVEVLPAGGGEWTENTDLASAVWSNGERGIRIPLGAEIEKVRLTVYSAYDRNHVVLRRTFDIIQNDKDYYETHGKLVYRTGEYRKNQADVFAKVDVSIENYLPEGGLTDEIEVVNTNGVAFDFATANSYDSVATSDFFDANKLTVNYKPSTFEYTANNVDFGESNNQHAKFAIKGTDGNTVYALGAKLVYKVTHEINTADELEEWLGIARYNVGQAYDDSTNKIYPYGGYSSMQWGGYFVLGNDIDCLTSTDGWNYSTHAIMYSNILQSAVDFDNGSDKDEIVQLETQEATLANAATLIKSWSGGNWCYGESTTTDGVINGNSNHIGFSGTFDGNGYTIDHYDSAGVIAGGFIGVLAEGGTLRNVNFTNAVFGGWSGFLTHSCAGTIENVYLQMSAVYGGNAENPSGLFFSADKYTSENTNINGGLMSTGSIRNCFADLTNATAGELDSNHMAKFGGNKVSGSTLSRVYMVCNNTESNMATYCGLPGIKLGGGNNGETTWNCFDIKGENDVGAGGTIHFTGWATAGYNVGNMGSYWTVKDGLPYPVSMLQA